MLKSLKKFKDKVNVKLLMLMGTPALSFASSANPDELNGAFGFSSGQTKSWLGDLLSKPFINIPLKIIIILGIIYAIFNIAKDLLSGQGQQGSVWKNAGAILALGLLYYVLFIKIAS